MVYLIGQQQKTQKDIWAGEMKCGSCGIISSFHLYKIKIVFSIFFIPFISVTTKRLLVCDNCQSCYEITKEQYKEIKQKQTERIESTGMPTSVVAQDYNPKELKYGCKIFGLVCAAILCFIMSMGAIGMLSDVGKDMSVIIGMVIMLSIGIVPLIFAIRAVSKAKKARELFHQTVAKENVK